MAAEAHNGVCSTSVNPTKLANAFRMPHIHPSVLQALPDRALQGARRGDPSALGPELCGILDVNFRAYPFHALR